MLEKLRRLFDPAGDSVQADPQRQVQLAATALLLEVSHADHDVDQQEIDSVLEIASKAFALDQQELKKFFTEAELQKQASTSLYEFTDLINRHYDENKKVALIEQLWRVAYADGDLDRYEEHTIRKVAELIYVSHSDFIRSKHSVAAEINRGK